MCAVFTFNHIMKEFCGGVGRCGFFKERDSVGQTIAKVIAKQVILFLFFEEIRHIIYVIRQGGKKKGPPFRHV